MLFRSKMKNILFQDNQSAIYLEKNGKGSSTGNTRHINIRYFFIKDRVSKGEIEVLYCPTTSMLGDFYSKPLQGELFRYYRAILMGHVSIEEIIHRTLKMKECVGENSISSKYDSRLIFKMDEQNKKLAETEKVKEWGRTGSNDVAKKVRTLG